MYPVMINIKNQKVVFVGGGQVAARKVKKLLQEGAKITIISPSLSAELDPSLVDWQARPYRVGDLAGAKLVFACTDNPVVNRQVMADAHPSQLVNNVGDKHDSDFYNVAIAEHDDFSVMISTKGRSPQRSKAIRQKLASLLDQL